VAVSKRLVARPAIWTMILLALAAAAILIHGGAFAKKAYFDQAASRGKMALRLAVAVLRGQMSSYQALRALIADHYDIQALLAEPQNAALRAKANAYLKGINGLLASSDIHVIKPGAHVRREAGEEDALVTMAGEEATCELALSQAT